MYSEIELREIFGRNVKLRRFKKGLSQEQLACKANVSKNTISVIESGQKFVHAKTLILLANTLGTEVYELFKPDDVYPDKAREIIMRFSEQVRDAVDNIEDRYFDNRKKHQKR